MSFIKLPLRNATSIFSLLIRLNASVMPISWRMWTDSKRDNKINVMGMVVVLDGTWALLTNGKMGGNHTTLEAEAFDFRILPRRHG